MSGGGGVCRRGRVCADELYLFVAEEGRGEECREAPAEAGEGTGGGGWRGGVGVVCVL